MTRLLSPSMMNAFKSGTLAPLLEVVHRDRDLILDIRDDKADIYCKGQVVVHVEPSSGGTYVLSADKAFWERTTRVVASIAETQHFVADELPHIKQRIAEHRKSPRGGGLEIEFEQLMIRANTQEPGLNTEYFAIDRQVLVGNGGERIDVLGVCWPRGDRAGSTALSPALIEVKYGLKGGVDGLVGQLERYYRAMAERAEAVAVEAEGRLSGVFRVDAESLSQRIAPLLDGGEGVVLRCRPPFDLQPDLLTKLGGKLLLLCRTRHIVDVERGHGRVHGDD